MIARLLAAACVAFAPCSTAKAAYTFKPVASGFEAPDYVTSAPGAPDTLYVVEQAGRIRTEKGGQITGTFLDITSLVQLGDERGLLSMAFSPGYARNHRFYVYYTDLQGSLRVVEYRSDGATAIPSSARQLLFAKHTRKGQNGGQLQFDRQGLLYIGTGDEENRGSPDPSQTAASPLGKILRINPLKAGANWQIVGYGLRNPWRFSFDRRTGDMWLSDVGASKFEEVDFRPRERLGRPANYGWDRLEGTTLWDQSTRLIASAELVSPTLVYPHADGACTVIGGYVYRGSAAPAARGRYFYGDFCNGSVWSFAAAKGRASALRRETVTIPSLSSFGEDGRGELYATSLKGTLYQLAP